MNAIGCQLKEVREQWALSQEALARLIGVSVRTVVGGEHGESTPSPLALQKLQEIGVNKEDWSQ